ncbi:hypothetical protein JOF29_000188 [Kribbella aluminosa]|uniref:Rv3651-like N-terminal domain-containing protein n=1 Tax=Kribbella aluminosa TaxID=416017 RepID=A0ABS4UBT6_9ACTN|nr:Imm1 family immunity protein [Kribbella aluminosa]MBP2349105.1 hypothetical protein [Kribbella aluminosa]
MTWTIRPVAERELWNFIPQMWVGPLCLLGGWGHGDVEAVLGPTNPTYRHEKMFQATFPLHGVTTYYEDDILQAVAIDALAGPRVRFVDQVELTGRAPSEVDAWFLEHFTESSRINQDGEIANDQLGLVVRTQRAGDILLTRPVFVSRRWADGCGDTQESSVPEINYDRHVFGWRGPEPVLTATYAVGGKVVKGQRVPTPEDLRELFDEIASGPRPIDLDLWRHDGPAMMEVHLGRQFSSLRFYDWGAGGNERGEPFYSVGTLDDPADAEGDFDGLSAEIRPDSAIRDAEARFAASVFLLTGSRPHNITWTVRAWEELWHSTGDEDEGSINRLG